MDHNSRYRQSFSRRHGVFPLPNRLFRVIHARKAGWSSTTQGRADNGRAAPSPWKIDSEQPSREEGGLVRLEQPAIRAPPHPARARPISSAFLRDPDPGRVRFPGRVVRVRNERVGSGPVVRPRSPIFLRMIRHPRDVVIIIIHDPIHSSHVSSSSSFSSSYLGRVRSSTRRRRRRGRRASHARGRHHHHHHPE